MPFPYLVHDFNCTPDRVGMESGHSFPLRGVGTPLVCYSVGRGGVLAADPTATGTPPPGPAAAIPDAHQSAADMFYYPTSE